MKNGRNAGRKPQINNDQLSNIMSRLELGESVSALALEYGVSRQAIYKRIHAYESCQAIKIAYHADSENGTLMEIYSQNEELLITNYGNRISKYAFGLTYNPSWNDLSSFFEQKYMELHLPTNVDFYCRDLKHNSFSVQEIISSDVNTHNFIITAGDTSLLPSFSFSRNDLLYARTDTDGYQLKALSHNRKHFVKAQAIIGGITMDDWAVELIASDLCEQLYIPCVKQSYCNFVYHGKTYNAVYSDNFELDGYTFISFESLLERNGRSTHDDDFIKLNAIDKLKWCASSLSRCCNINYSLTFKYMLDNAVIDCLVGNVDRHTRNFGAIYNTYTSAYEIAPLFDNGMGLFEHDIYKLEYKNFDEAMRNVYVSPYGEDPFDFFEMLDKEFHLLEYYPELKNIKYNLSNWSTPFAQEYMERMQTLCQKLD